MVMKAEYDFLTWRSFPSSIKLINDWGQSWTPYTVPVVLPVTPGSTIKIEVSAKQEKVVYSISHVRTDDWNGIEWKPNPIPNRIVLPQGSFDWRTASIAYENPSGVIAIRPLLAGGAGSPEAPGITWFDDLKIYQDDKLIYSDDFSNWAPAIGAGVGAPIGGVAGYLLKEPLGPMVSEVVGAVVGGAVGGGIGLLTGLGIIPVPQIPALGAAPEGPGAPARLGKYLITG